MELRRFYAKDLGHGMQTVKQTLGPNAVILGSSKVDGQIEIVAASEYDEGLYKEIAGTTGAPLQSPKTKDITVMDTELHGELSTLQQTLKKELEQLNEYKQQRKAADRKSEAIPEELQAELFLLRKSLRKELNQLAEYRKNREQLDAEPDPVVENLQSRLNDLQGMLEQEITELSEYRQQRLNFDAELDPSHEGTAGRTA